MITTKETLTKETLTKEIYCYKCKKLAEDFLEYIKHSKPYIINSLLKSKKPADLIIDWCDVIDKLIRLDNYSLGEIIRACKYGLTDDFWQTNFYSIAKLRKKNKEKVMYIAIFLDRIESDKTPQQRNIDFLDKMINEIKEDK